MFFHATGDPFYNYMTSLVHSHGVIEKKNHYFFQFVNPDIDTNVEVIGHLNVQPSGII